ncbi:MAG: potassium channel family protein [Streptosporangiaceae bacterium]
MLERHAPRSNIHTLGEALWWSAVTVTTAGYGAIFPVTTAGRITACFIIGIGLLTLPVVTAQVASSFACWARRWRRPHLGRVPWIFVAGSCRSVRCLID